MHPPELFQFRFSHYNEKARWALDYKAVPHRRHSYLPGPHALSIMRLSKQKSVPVLRAGTEVIAGSARIIDYLERNYPDPALYPVEAEARTQALDIQRRFDETVGPEIRRAFFFEVLQDGAYVAGLFSQDRSALVKGLYRAAFPGIRVVMKQDMRINERGAQAGRARTMEALDYVASHVGPEGYLVGNRFSVADLAAAAILSPAVMPAEFPVHLQEPKPASFRSWLARWADHPGVAWVRNIYQQHRGTSAEVEKS